MEDPTKPPTLTEQTPDGVTWFAIRDYGHRLEGLREGTGCFLTFQSTNVDELMNDWVMLNGGLIDRTAGKEQGDLDLLIHVDGQIGGMALVGNMQEFGGSPPALEPINDNQMSLGNKNNRWVDLWLSGHLNVTTEGRQIFLEGRWQWVDCVVVKTQQGERCIPTYVDASQVKPNLIQGA